MIAWNRYVEIFDACRTVAYYHDGEARVIVWKSFVEPISSSELTRPNWTDSISILGMRPLVRSINIEDVCLDGGREFEEWLQLKRAEQHVLGGIRWGWVSKNSETQEVRIMYT